MARSRGTNIDNTLPHYLSNPISRKKPPRENDTYRDISVNRNNRILLSKLLDISKGKACAYSHKTYKPKIQHSLSPYTVLRR